MRLKYAVPLVFILSLPLPACTGKLDRIKELRQIARTVEQVLKTIPKKPDEKKENNLSFVK